MFYLFSGLPLEWANFWDLESKPSDIYSISGTMYTVVAKIIRTLVFSAAKNGFK